MRARALVALAAAALAASCGPGAAPDVSVELTDTTVTLDRTEIAAGHRVIAIRNRGTTVHELEVLRTDAPPDALPYDPRSAQVSARDVVAERENIPVGATKRLSVDLTAGSYVLLCDLPGHYAAGMRGGLAVR